MQAAIQRWVLALLAAGIWAGSSVRAQSLAEPADLIGVYLTTRELYLYIAPPGDEGYLQDLRDAIYTFDAKTFDPDFLVGLTGIAEDGAVYYRVTLAEDPSTRERLVYNDQGELIWVAAAPGDYRPELETSTRGEVYPLGADDPARIRIVVTLMDAEDKAALDARLEEQFWAEGLTASVLGGDFESLGMDGMWWETSWPSNLQFVATAVGAGEVALTLACPWDFTNRIEIYRFDSGDAPEHEQLAGTNNFWELLATNIEAVAGGTVVYTNSGLTAIPRRFYVAGNGDLDTDGDRLVDAREIFLYHTGTTTNDTDGDGIGDYTEVLVDKTDPHNDDTTPPRITLLAPTAGEFDAWVP